MDGGLRRMDFIKKKDLLQPKLDQMKQAIWIWKQAHWFPTSTDVWENDYRDAYKEDLALLFRQWGRFYNCKVKWF